jgi:U4/U6.U5 small nuclear ribonucleoproteins
MLKSTVLEREPRRGEGSSVKEEQPEAKMTIDTKEPVTAEGVTEEDMMAMMGFAGFGTTKVSSSLVLLGLTTYRPVHSQGQAVEGNQEGAVKINQQRTWRQYMNRFVRAVFSLFTTYRLILQEGRFQQASGEGQIAYIIFYSIAA